MQLFAYLFQIPKVRFRFECIKSARYSGGMKNFIKTSLCALTVAALSACATAPDPAEICTSEWIGKRSDKAIASIESKAGRSIKALTKAAESWSKGKKPNFIQMLALRNSFSGLEKELTTGRGMKDLKTLASTCNDPNIISKAMGGLLRKQDLPDNMINFIENFEPYRRVITPDAVPLKTAQLLTD